MRELRSHEWLSVDNNAKAAIKSTKSYSRAIRHTLRMSELLKWDEPITVFTIKAIDKIYSGNSPLIDGKKKDMKEAT